MVVRRADGTEVHVHPDHLELIAPDHPLHPEGDGTHARWWLDQLDDWDHALTVGAFVPRSLPAVCTVLHPWTAGGHDLTWQTVADQFGLDDRAALGRLLADDEVGAAELPMTGPAAPPPGQLDARLAATLIDVLSDATTTPDDVFVAIWEGWGDTLPARFPGAARVEIPWRGHFLLRGPLIGVQTSVSAISGDTTAASGAWWPADRAWLVHTEIDFHWTFIGGTPELIDALFTTPELECLRTHHYAHGNTLSI